MPKPKKNTKKSKKSTKKVAKTPKSTYSVVIEKPTSRSITEVISTLNKANLLRNKSYRQVPKEYLVKNGISKEVASAWTESSFSSTITISNAVHKKLLDHYDEVVKEFPQMKELVEKVGPKKKGSNKKEIEKLNVELLAQSELMSTAISSGNFQLAQEINQKVEEIRQKISDLKGNKKVIQNANGVNSDEYTISTPNLLKILLLALNKCVPSVISVKEAEELASVGTIKNKIENIVKTAIVCLEPTVIKPIATFNGQGLNNYVKIVRDSDIRAGIRLTDVNADLLKDKVEDYRAVVVSTEEYNKRFAPKPTIEDKPKTE